MNPEKLAKLQAQVRIGGKGSQRRKKKFVHRSSATDDKKQQKEAAARKTEASADAAAAAPCCSSESCKEGPKLAAASCSGHSRQQSTAATFTELSNILADCCKVSTAKVALGKNVAVENDGKFGNQKSHGSEVAHRPGIFNPILPFTGGTIIIRSDKIDKKLLEFVSNIQEWRDLKFYTIGTLEKLEAALNSGIECEKTHALRARCTVFFTRVDKDLLTKIKNETENENLRKKAEKDSSVTIEDVRHIGLGRTIRVHCRTPTGAKTIIKNGLSIGGLILRKGKLEELKPIVQCTHCWKVDHKIGNCALSRAKEPPICGTCGKAGHRRKDCPTPNDPNCILCGGKHSASAAKCLVRQEKIKKVEKIKKALDSGNNVTSIPTIV